ncbi:hypothetical protein [Paenibacillus sp. DCT19]|uniref:hypothetical protein n=1 Tax=Paenibacillus sp. DCT19 TaxID=2211212 RepID=UPI000FE27A4C|nr:hypothetical protein [Paenibacillus sp. DCT19]
MNRKRLHTGKSLQQRLSELQGKLAELNAPLSGLEPGRISRVYTRHFIKVNRQLFIPLSLYSIRVFDIPPTCRGVRVGIRTVFPSGNEFNNIRLVGIGRDYLELQGKGKFPSRILFPLSQVESIYRSTTHRKK